MNELADPIRCVPIRSRPSLRGRDRAGKRRRGEVGRERRDSRVHALDECGGLICVMSERSGAVRYVTTRCGRFSGVGKERAGGGGEKTGEKDVDDGLTYRTATDARFPSLKRYQTWPDTFRPVAADPRRPDASDRREAGRSRKRTSGGGSATRAEVS